MKRKIWLFFLTIIGIPLLFIINCNKYEPEPKPKYIIYLPIFNPSVTYGSVKDQDGNTYKTVTIGTQIWMAENLRVIHYADGTPISNIADKAIWVSLTDTAKAYCWYNNDSATYSQAYGALYNWAAAMNGAKSSSSIPSGIQGVCPTGWHIPSKGEWDTLITYLGGESIVGGKLKENGMIHWKSPNTGATNESGFTALPGGFRDCINYPEFDNIGEHGIWWNSTGAGGGGGVMLLSYRRSNIITGNFDTDLGISVRCVKD
jgi:uncharacterized protein (TIGR02145 family)